jgi:arabinofuranosyltransferase
VRAARAWSADGLARALLIAYLALLLKNAWLTDDAYITFRTVDNFVSGHGLRFNVAERVQAYTHPLWMLVIAASYVLTREMYWTALVVSIATSLAAALVVYRMTYGLGRLVALTLLLASKAYGDFSSSGLENPLSHLLFALFVVEYTSDHRHRARLFRLSLLAGLAALNRLDTALIYAPMLLATWFQTPTLRAARTAFLGLAPIWLWTLFSLLYYGAPVPNTAYAKLALAVPLIDKLGWGTHYLGNSLRKDPWTLIAIAIAASLTCKVRGRSLSIAVGMVLYVAYVVAIGGDFMSGRFLALPYLAATILIAMNVRLLPRLWLLAGALMLLCSLFMSSSDHLLSGPHFGDVPLVQTRSAGKLPLSLIEDGICDERAFYFQTTGLLRAEPGTPTHPWFAFGEQARKRSARVLVWPFLGFFGFSAGPSVHIVDPHALADPLLARLAPAGGDLRPGHLPRSIPEGYIASLERDQNLVRDPQVHVLYDAVRLATRAPLFATGRLRAVWALQTGSLSVEAPGSATD